MPIDFFDRKVLEMSGQNPQDILFELYGKKIGRNNAEKQLAGIRTHINFKANLADAREIGEMEEIVIKADGSVTSKRMLLLSETESQNPYTVMKLMGYDPGEWTMVYCRAYRKFWDVSMKLRKVIGYMDDGKPIYVDEPEKKTNHAYNCEVKILPKLEGLSTDIIKEVFDKLTPPKLEKYIYKQTSGNLLELPIMDVHLGKLSWRDECGDDYDLKIAESLYRETVIEFLRRIKEYNLKIDSILFPIGQDYYHFDTTTSTTTKGTSMDTDTRWQKMYSKGVELAIWTIENLREIAPVTVPYVASNHDKMLSFCLTNHINAYFRNIDDVDVRISPYPRQYFKWGKCLIGYSHGSEEGKRIEKLMQDESPDWSDTIFREFHLGHIHSEQVREDVGLIIRNISSITSRDNWHTEHGYKATRKAQAFVWNDNKGKQLTIDVNVTV